VFDFFGEKTKAVIAMAHIGVTWNPVDGDRVKRFRDKVATMR
jgi:hypothetical protein